MINSNSVIIETENLFLKKFETTDFRNFLSLHQNPEIMKYFDGGAKTLEQARKRFNEVIEHQNRYGFSYYNVLLKDSYKYIGQAGLYYNYDMSVNLCYAFLEKFQRKGYATEAIIAILKYGFEKLNFAVITAMSDPDNKGSIRLLEKIGAKFIMERRLSSGMLVFCYSIERNNFYNAILNIKKCKFRKAVGSILIDKDGLIYLFQRCDFKTCWQGAEGGIDEGETALQAIYRETEEELGVDRSKLELLAETNSFIRYKYLDNRTVNGCDGQEKKFFLFRFTGDANDFNYKSTNIEREFLDYKLVSKNEVLNFISDFKKDMYKIVLEEFDKYLK